MLHQEMKFREDDIRFLSKNTLEKIINSKRFGGIPLEIQDKILELRDLLDRY